MSPGPPGEKCKRYLRAMQPLLLLCYFLTQWLRRKADQVRWHGFNVRTRKTFFSFLFHFFAKTQSGKTDRSFASGRKNSQLLRHSHTLDYSLPLLAGCGFIVQIEREGEGKRREHVHQSFKEATVRPRRPVAVTFHGRWRKWKIAKKSKRQTQNFKGLKIQT